MSLAKRIGRPYRILVHNDPMRIPDLATVERPIFAHVRRTVCPGIGRHDHHFPRRGAATAAGIFGRAIELARKPFAARLVRRAGAYILPIFIEAQNTPIFRLASRINATLRLALIVSEARRQIGGMITLRIGEPIEASEIPIIADEALMSKLYRRVQRLRGPPN